MLLTFDSTQQPPLEVTQKIIIEAAVNALKQLPKKEQQLIIAGI